jgi:hypothetical protein
MSNFVDSFFSEEEYWKEVIILLRVSLTIIIWCCMIVFVLEMRRVRVMITSRNHLHYTIEQKRNKILMWSLIGIHLVSLALTLFTFIGQENFPGFYMKH